MNMKWKAAIVACLLFAALLMGGTAIMSINAGAEAQPAAKTESAAGEYRVAEYKGYVAVYEGESENPITVTDIELVTLPQPDRAAVRVGIYLENREKLMELLEDFSS